MAADREVEDVDRQGQAAIGPHPSRDARAARGPGFRKDLMDPLRLDVAGDRGRDLRRQQQRGPGFIRAQQTALDHLVPQVKYQRSHAGRRGHEDVQERAPRRRPAATREIVLLAIDRQVVAVLGRDDFAGHARVVAVAFDQALRPRRFFHSACRLAFAGIFGNPGHPDLELGPLEFERLLAVVADQLPRAMLGTASGFRRRFQGDFVTRKVSGKRLVAGLPRFVEPTLVLLDDDLFCLFHRGGQSLRRIGGLWRVAEVELQLVGIFPIPLAAIAEGALQELVDREFLLLHLAMQLGDRPGLLDGRVAEFADLPVLLDEERLTGGKVGRKELPVVHVSRYSGCFGMRKMIPSITSIPECKRGLAKEFCIFRKTKKGFSRRVVREKPRSNNDQSRRCKGLLSARPRVAFATLQRIERDAA